jgi:NTP pyrophosphatase (non-canonical NTP hydrolase)
VNTDALFNAVLEEAAYASERWGDFASSHEALGVLTEEYHELLEAVRLNNVEWMRREAIQVSAVALRLAHACEMGAFIARSSKS